MGVDFATVKEQLLGQDHLKSNEKDALLSLLSASGVFPECQDDWIDMGTTSAGLKSAKQIPVAPERVYRIRGTLKMKAAVENVVEVTVNPINMKKWDWLAKELTVLQANIDRPNGVNRLVAYGRFGITLFSPIFYDRDYLTRVTAVRLPCGAYLSHVTSMPPDVKVDGDPGPQLRVVRGHSGHSGWVLLPQDNGSTLATLILQMDPMGTVPLSVVNYLATFIPSSLLRVRKFVESQDPAALAKMQEARLTAYEGLPGVGTGWATNGAVDDLHQVQPQGSGEAAATAAPAGRQAAAGQTPAAGSGPVPTINVAAG